jgi:two-component system chemotaxis response regulator CheB
MALTIRVLVVDDSALIRQMLSRALSMDPRIDIVGTAKNGVEAIEKARELSPDVVTLDIEMPELTGLEALPHIRKHTRARVVMLSSLDDSDTTYRALSLGAVDFLAKPHSGVAGSITELTDTLLKKIKTAYRITPEQASAAVEEGVVQAPPTHGGPLSVADSLAVVVGIAASTGGPPALERVFAGLPASMPAAYLIVQHLPAGFSASLARRLSSVSEIEVVEAAAGMVIEPGRGYVAPHGRHMEIERHGAVAKICFSEAASMHGVCPAADPLFESIAREYGHNGVAAVLTGMGADGARGASAVKKAGGDVVAQDEATSVVWGMPGAVVRMGVAGRVVPVGLVAAEIRRAIRARSEISGN